MSLIKPLLISAAALGASAALPAEAHCRHASHHWTPAAYHHSHHRAPVRTRTVYVRQPVVVQRTVVVREPVVVRRTVVVNRPVYRPPVRTVVVARPVYAPPPVRTVVVARPVYTPQPWYANLWTGFSGFRW